MRSIFTVFLLLLLVLPNAAQNLDFKKNLTESDPLSVIQSNLFPDNKKIFSNDNYRLSELILRYYENTTDTVIKKYSYEYDERGNEISTLVQEKNNGVWENDDIYIKTYDAQSNMTEFFDKYWDNEWLLNLQYTFKYNVAKNITECIYYNPFQRDTLQNILFNYNPDGTVKGYVSQNFRNGVWADDVGQDYEYNNLGLLINRVDYIVGDDGKWRNAVMYSVNYNSSSLPGEIIRKTWNKTDSSWTEKEKISYKYDAEGHLTDYIDSALVDGVWDYSRRVSATFDAAGRILTETRYEMNTEGEDIFRTSNEYDENGNITTILEEGKSGENWLNMSKKLYKYDSYGNCIEGKGLVWDIDKWSYNNSNLKIPQDDILYFNVQNIFTMGHIVLKTYHSAFHYEAVYKKISIGIEDDKLHPVEFSLSQNYPNPFNPETKISFSLPQSGKTTLKIYDMLGREVAGLVNGVMEKGRHEVNFNGRNLSSGVYIYRLQSGSFMESKKMMLLK